jgi:hypothetical protein
MPFTNVNSMLPVTLRAFRERSDYEMVQATITRVA